MAADPFAFYRGSAPLFYSDVDRLDDPWVDDATSRVWIQGDLHAENYGTYMDSAGVLVFDVNDFDEAYLGPLHVGPAADGGVAGAARVPQGAARTRASRELIETYARRLRGDRAAVRDLRGRPRLPADARTTPRGRCTRCSRTARLQTRRAAARDDDDDRRRRPPARASCRACASSSRTRRTPCSPPTQEYLETIPEAKRQQSISYAVKDIVGRSGFGIGSAGLRAYNLLVEGRTQALENDVVLSMKQAQTPAVSRIVTRRADPLLLRARGPPHRGLPGRAAGALRPVGGLVLARRRRPGDQGALALRGRPRLGRRHRDGRDGPARATTSAARRRRSTASPTRATSTRWSTSTSRRRSPP